MERSFKDADGDTITVSYDHNDRIITIESEIVCESVEILKDDLPDLIDILLDIQNLKEITKYSLWKGSHGTFIDKLTCAEDLPTIHVGAGGKTEKFDRIGPNFVKTNNGFEYV